MGSKYADLKRIDQQIKQAFEEKKHNQALLNTAQEKEKRLHPVLDLIAKDDYEKVQDDITTYTILIEADLGYTTKVLFSEIHKKIGFDGSGTIYQMGLDIIQKLKNSGRLIIIDEAEHLPYKALDLLRRIYDKAGIGILLVGMPRLISNLRGLKGQYAQLYSRVGIATRLKCRIRSVFWHGFSKTKF